MSGNIEKFIAQPSAQSQVLNPPILPSLNGRETNCCKTDPKIMLRLFNRIPKISAQYLLWGPSNGIFSVGQCKSSYPAVVKRESSRAANYNAYHKLAVAVAEVWGSAIRAVSWFWRCNKHTCPLTSDLGFWRILEVPDCGLQSWSWFGWLLVFVTPMFQILAYSLPFKGSKNIHVLTGVWHLDFDLNMFTDLWYPNIPNFGSLSWFWRCKEHPCPLSPIYGLWLGLEVPDWGLASWSWFGYGHWFLIYLYSDFWLHLDF